MVEDDVIFPRRIYGISNENNYSNRSAFAAKVIADREVAHFLDGRATWHNGFNDTPYDFLRRIEIMIAYIHGEWGGAWEGHLPAGPDGLRSTTTRRRGREGWRASRPPSSHARVAFLSCLIYYSAAYGRENVIC